MKPRAIWQLLLVANWLSVSATASTYSYYQAESLELTMFVHLYVGAADAQKLFEENGKDPSHALRGDSFLEHFNVYVECNLRRFGAILHIDRPSGLFVLKFRDYLAHLPQDFIDMEITIVKVEIVRFNSAPTSARAGYYENPKSGFTALIERVFPTQHDQYKKPVPLYAQNITVSGPSLDAAQEFNTKVSTGSYNRFLVNAFE